jgi:hypothetical protein
MIEDSDIVRHQLDFRQHVGGNQYCAIVETRQRLYQIANFMDAGGVEAI